MTRSKTFGYLVMAMFFVLGFAGSRAIEATAQQPGGGTVGTQTVCSAGSITGRDSGGTVTGATYSGTSTFTFDCNTGIVSYCGLCAETVVFKGTSIATANTTYVGSSLASTGYVACGSTGNTVVFTESLTGMMPGFFYKLTYLASPSPQNNAPCPDVLDPSYFAYDSIVVQGP